MLRTIHLEGPFKELYSEAIELEADTPSALLSGLKANFDGFERQLRSAEGFYLVGRSDANEKLKSIDFANWLMPLGEYKDIHIIPIIKGQGYEAAAYVYAALESYGTYIAAAAAVVTFVAVTYATAMIAAALMPAPDATIGSASQNAPSFIFNGAENTVLEGVPVPLVYGRVLTGSVVISVDQDVVDIPVIPETQAEG